MTEGRTCTKCGEFKLFLNFESQGIKTRADGSTYRKYRAQCKLCMKDKVQQWNQNYRTRNGDAIRARNRKQWRIEHPPKEPKPKLCGVLMLNSPRFQTSKNFRQLVAQFIHVFHFLNSLKSSVVHVWLLPNFEVYP